MAKPYRDTDVDEMDDERPPAPLNFDQRHDEDSRAADYAHAARTPKVRRTAATGANTDVPGAEVMADEMADEVLLGEDGLPTSDYLSNDLTLDTVLSTEDVSLIGVGDEPDEAELADIDPLRKRERKALQAKIAQHARDPNAFEPAEAEMQRTLREAAAP